MRVRAVTSTLIIITLTSIEAASLGLVNVEIGQEDAPLFARLVWAIR